MRTEVRLALLLRDGTVEVKECKQKGSSPSLNLLNRSKLPKDTFFNPDTPMYDANQPKAVSWEDLRCGSTIMVWGRSSPLPSCDRTTELFYQRKGIAQNPMQVEEDKGPAFPKTLPPYNGVGAENDPYSMGLSLQPKIVKSTTDEFKRWQMADNKVLRFEMEFAHSDVSTWTSSGASSPTTTWATTRSWSSSRRSAIPVSRRASF